MPPPPRRMGSRSSHPVHLARWPLVAEDGGRAVLSSAVCRDELGMLFRSFLYSSRTASAYDAESSYSHDDDDACNSGRRMGY